MTWAQPSFLKGLGLGRHGQQLSLGLPHTTCVWTSWLFSDFSTVQHVQNTVQNNAGTVTVASSDFVSQQPLALSGGRAVQLLTFLLGLLLPHFIWYINVY